MTVSASCGNCPPPGACSASAVASSAPQVRAAPSSRTGRRGGRRRRRPPVGLGHLEVVGAAGAAPAGRRPEARPAGAHRVGERPHDVQRLLVAEPPGAAGAGELTGLARVAQVVAAAGGRPGRRRPGAARSRRAGGAPWGELQPAAAAVDVALGLQLALQPAAAPPGRRPSPPRARRTASTSMSSSVAPGSPGRRRRAARRGRPGPAARWSASPEPSGSSPRTRSAADQSRSGRRLRRLLAELRHLLGQAHVLERPAISAASSSRCCGESERSIRSRRRRPAGEGVDQLLEVAGCSGKTRRTPP